MRAYTQVNLNVLQARSAATSCVQPNASINTSLIVFECLSVRAGSSIRLHVDWFERCSGVSICAKHDSHAVACTIVFECTDTLKGAHLSVFTRELRYLELC